MMRLPIFVFFALALAGCSRTGGAPALPAPAGAASAHTARPAVGFATLFSFDGANGQRPVAALTPLDGTFYGTTSGGGEQGTGVVFSLTPAGVENVLHSFAGLPDGSGPLGPLTVLKKKLYGTTYQGGIDSNGSVFSLAATGQKYKTLYSFAGNPSDGGAPEASLLDVNGTLYGTTVSGGAANVGTVFTISKSGTENVLYNFQNDAADGAYPYAGLIEVKGALYGTTKNGGAHGFGSVFKITPGGSETVVYSFGSAPDGQNPIGDLVFFGGALYGTTLNGGSANDGTVFKVTTAGVDTVLHSFGAGKDGLFPSVALAADGSSLYGTTYSGGAAGEGCVFAITTSGKESVVYSFKGSDGAYPLAALIDVSGTLYGTTSEGGASGAGTVFSLTP